MKKSHLEKTFFTSVKIWRSFHGSSPWSILNWWIPYSLRTNKSSYNSLKYTHGHIFTTFYIRRSFMRADKTSFHSVPVRWRSRSKLRRCSYAYNWSSIIHMSVQRHMRFSLCKCGIRVQLILYNEFILYIRHRWCILH